MDRAESAASSHSALQGVDSVLNADEKYGALQRFIVGTNGSGVVTSTAGAARVGPNVDVYGQFLYRNSSSYLDGNGNVVPDSGSSVVGGLFKLNVRPSEGQQISLSALTQNDKFANNGTSTSGARFDDNVLTGTYTLGYTYKAPSTPLIDLSSHVYYATTQNRQTFIAPDLDGVYSALGVQPGAPLEDKINSYGFDLHNTARFTTGMLNHALTVGGDGTLDRVTTFDNAGGFISALTPSGNRSLWGAYVQDEISYNSWLRVLGALARGRLSSLGRRRQLRRNASFAQADDRHNADPRHRILRHLCSRVSRAIGDRDADRRRASVSVIHLPAQPEPHRRDRSRLGGGRQPEIRQCVSSRATACAARARSSPIWSTTSSTSSRSASRF